MNDVSIPASRITLPWRHVSDKKFRYVEAAKTDVRRAWRRARLLMRLQGKKEVAA